MRNPARRFRGGFTVVEALTAGMILVMASVVLGGMVVGAMQSLRIAADTQRAAHLLDRTLTKIDMIGPSRLLAEGPTDGGFEAPDDRFRWEADIESRLEGNLYEVTVRILWDTERGTRSVEAATLLNDPPLSRNPTLMWDDL